MKQADNCLNVAMESRDQPFIAELIDEAARLRARARQIDEQS